MTFYSDASIDDQLATSYTATSDSIRDSAAQLAGMALRSDDEHGNDSRIIEAEEEEEDVDDVPEQRRRGDSTTPQSWSLPQPSTSPFARSYGTTASTGPSNLAKALSASRPASPDGGGSAAPTPTQSIPAFNDERSPLLPPQGRQQQQQRQPSRTARKPRQDSVASSRSDALDSGFSVSSQHFREAMSEGRRMGVRSTYGSGALAQASMEAEAETTLGRSVDESRDGGDEDDDYDEEDDNEEAITDSEAGAAYAEPISPAWKLLPTSWRPGGAARRTRPWIKISNGDAASITPTPPLTSRLRKLTRKEIAEACAEPVRLLPATVLGVLMNILDGVSYGLITFPASYPIFADFGGDGVAMFFISCVISQLVFSLGGSIFKGESCAFVYISAAGTSCSPVICSLRSSDALHTFPYTWGIRNRLKAATVV